MLDVIIFDWLWHFCAFCSGKGTYWYIWACSFVNQGKLSKFLFLIFVCLFVCGLWEVIHHGFLMFLYVFWAKGRLLANQYVSLWGKVLAGFLAALFTRLGFLTLKVSQLSHKASTCTPLSWPTLHYFWESGMGKGSPREHTIHAACFALTLHVSSASFYESWSG